MQFILFLYSFFFFSRQININLLYCEKYSQWNSHRFILRLAIFLSKIRYLKNRYISGIRPSSFCLFSSILCISWKHVASSSFPMFSPISIVADKFPRWRKFETRQKKKSSRPVRFKRVRKSTKKSTLDIIHVTGRCHRRGSTCYWTTTRYFLTGSNPWVGKARMRNYTVTYVV